MNERLKEIFSLLPNASVFADVGCDHGYVAKEVLKSGKAEKVIISDISAKCLAKAESLLEDEIADGKAISVVSNGFEKLPKCDLALIAGMGGEEIISILKNAWYMPQTLVLQPMKNLPKLRVFLVELGYKIIKDYVFTAEQKYYDLLLVEKGEDKLSDDEIEFGRTNLLEKGKAYLERLSKEINSLYFYAKQDGLSLENQRRFIEKAERLSKYV